MKATRRFSLRVDSEAYPAHLREIHRPPRVLHGMGDPYALVRGLGVIGSRKATPYGLQCAEMFAGTAAEWGVTIISGGAIGCDTRAHAAALEAGGSTVAVLGCGADVDYPRSSAATLSRIRNGGGAVVSELDWGASPLRGHFPARNRIIAGLSAAVLVVEAALPSGTFSTADHALDAGREVFAVPGSVFFAGSAGCNRLIRQGAQPITCEEDLRDALRDVGLIEDFGGGAASGPYSDASDDALLEALRADPMSPDRLAALTGLGIVDVLTRLTVLEQVGAAVRYPDGRYGPCRRA
jgi:DNA processing protein